MLLQGLFSTCIENVPVDSQPPTPRLTHGHRHFLSQMQISGKGADLKLPNAPRWGQRKRTNVTSPVSTTEVVIYCTGRVVPLQVGGGGEVGAAAINRCISLSNIYQYYLCFEKLRHLSERQLRTEANCERHLKSHHNKRFKQKL